MNMTGKRWAVLVTSVVVLSLVILAWITTEDGRRFDSHVRQALQRYELAFAREGARATPTPSPRNMSDPLFGVPPVDRVTVDRDGRTLTVEFVGGVFKGPCGMDYTARAVESNHAALVVVEPHRLGSQEMCSAVGVGRTATVQLNRPLGGRAVLEAMSGMPVPVGPAGSQGRRPVVPRGLSGDVFSGEPGG
jgi:hypothetical protein